MSHISDSTTQFPKIKYNLVLWRYINSVNLATDTSNRILHICSCTSRRHYRNMARTLKSMLHCLCICGYVGVGVWNSKLLTNVWVTLSSGGAGSHKLLIPHLKNTPELRARSITTLELRGGGETGKEESIKQERKECRNSDRLERETSLNLSNTVWVICRVTRSAKQN